jgi:CheY-like chemotaxis protein
MEFTKHTAAGEGFMMSSQANLFTSSAIGQWDSPMPKSSSRDIYEAEVLDLIPRGTERIVLVDDDRNLRKTTRMLLEDLGYQVEAYANGPEALTAMAQSRHPVALLLTDYEMPGLTGYQLIQLVLAEYPGVRILLASGRSEDSILPGCDPKYRPPFLPKPYSFSHLARRVREVLDGTEPESAKMVRVSQQQPFARSA